MKDVTGCAYIAIPAENISNTAPNIGEERCGRTRKRESLFLYVLYFLVFVVLVLPLLLLNGNGRNSCESHVRSGGERRDHSDRTSPDFWDEGEWRSQTYHNGHESKKVHCPHHHKRGMDKMFPTLLPGGGRDWVLSPQDGTILAKHQADLVLGSTPHPNLILVARGSKDAIVLDKDEMKKLSEGQEATMRGNALGIGLLYADEEEKKWGPWMYREAASLQGEQEMKQAVTLTYKDNNYLVLKHTDNTEITSRSGALVMDVSFWKLVENNTVNFVGAATDSIDVDAGRQEMPKRLLHDTVNWFKPKTFIPGGGRDWVLNMKEGTISPKRAGNLVLGLGIKKVILVKNTSSNKLIFDNLEELVKGDVNTSVPLKINGTDNGVGQQYNDPKLFGPWKFIETALVASDKAVSVRYVENNYIVVGEEGKELALDISFWKMVEGNTVNFVGGKVYKAEDDGHGALPPPFGPGHWPNPPFGPGHWPNPPFGLDNGTPFPLGDSRPSHHGGCSHFKHSGSWEHYPHHG